ncbi:CASP-like protein 1C1 [Cinnamomum micranthum f. kanehirae]|uniref:CASP-like protein n=1 Tax=Cinnamomum micranthum f. kanehirae TaxID=337451 RepID=A0A443PFL9_9MAGN|nr:CASP-like protein 1C1 [Cinnamomum micranthum f. kanehirae]
MEKNKRACTLLLRLLALGATISATVVMLTSHQSSTFLYISVDAKYQYIPAFKFFVVANVIGGVYSLLVLFLPQKSMLWRLVVALDVVVTMLLTAAVSAAAAIGYVGKKGNSHTGWLPVCNQFPKFCNHVTGALVLGFCGVLVYMFILLCAIHMVLNPLLL